MPALPEYSSTKQILNTILITNKLMLFSSNSGFYQYTIMLVTWKILFLNLSKIIFLQVRLQMNANPEQVGALTEMSRLVADEGMRALWKGVGPAMARATALTASQLATYDETKRVKF